MYSPGMRPSTFVRTKVKYVQVLQNIISTSTSTCTCATSENLQVKTHLNVFDYKHNYMYK